MLYKLQDMIICKFQCMSASRNYSEPNMYLDSVYHNVSHNYIVFSTNSIWLTDVYIVSQKYIFF